MRCGGCIAGNSATNNRILFKLSKDRHWLVRDCARYNKNMSIFNVIFCLNRPHLGNLPKFQLNRIKSILGICDFFNAKNTPVYDQQYDSLHNMWERYWICNLPKIIINLLPQHR